MISYSKPLYGIIYQIKILHMGKIHMQNILTEGWCRAKRSVFLNVGWSKKIRG